MDKVKLIDDELESFQKYTSVEQNYYLSLEVTVPNRNSAIIGLQSLGYDKRYLLCMNKVAYIVKGNKSFVELSFAGGNACCFAYVLIRKSDHPSDQEMSTHAFFIEDNTIEVYEVCGRDVCLSKKFKLPEKAHFIKETAKRPVASTGDTVFFCNDSHKIFAWDLKNETQNYEGGSIREVHYVALGELVFFGFLEQQTQLICIFESDFNGIIYAEFLRSVAGKYSVTNRIPLNSGDNSNYIVKQIDNEMIVFLTTAQTWLFRGHCQPLRVKNKGLPNDALLSMHIHVVSLDMMLIEVYFASGRIFSCNSPVMPDQNRILIWSETASFNATPKESLKFVNYLHGKSYISASDSQGISFHDLRKNSRRIIERCSYRSATYFDTASLPVEDEVTNCKLLCAAYNSRHGFLEKQIVRCQDYPATTTWSKSLEHSPVLNVWSTCKGLVYQNFEGLYSVEVEDQIEQFQDCLWLTKSGVPIRDEYHDIISISPVLGAGDRNIDAVVLLKKWGKVDIVDYSENRKKYQLQFEVEIKNSTTAVVAAYFSSDGHFYVAVSCGYESLSFFRDSSLIHRVHLATAFFVSDLSIKCISSRLYFIATSTDGKGVVFTFDSEEPLLEIEGNCGIEAQIFDPGDHSNNILIYSRSGLRVFDLVNRTYSHISFPVIPYKILVNERDTGDHKSFYVLDCNGRLHLMSCGILQDRIRPRLNNDNVISKTLDLGELIPLKILTMFNTRYALIVTKNYIKSKASISLFDIDDMRFAKDRILGKNCTHFILRPLWNDCSRLSSFTHYMLQKVILMYFIRDNVPIFQILRVQEDRFILQQEGKLPHPALTIFIDPIRMQVLFYGLKKTVYNIICDFGADKVLLKSSSGTSEGINGLGFFETEPGFIKLVANKNLERRFTHKNFPQKEVRLSPSAIMKQFLTSGNRYRVSREYQLTVDCHNNVNLFRFTGELVKGEGNRPYLSRRFKVHSQITNISPVPYNINSSTKTYESIPLFIITCGDGHILALNEIIGHKPGSHNEDIISSEGDNALRIYSAKATANSIDQSNY